MHGGTVEAHSEGQGHGSEFVVRLPLAESRPEGPAPAPPPPAAAGRRRRVLAVDDNRDSARTLTRLLQVLGHEVSTAHDGPAALAEADRFHPEIVLLDIGLPGMDGFEVARRLRASPAFADTVLIALTGYGSPEDRAASREAGFNAHLVKPVDLEALKELLARPLELLRHRRGD
jgi:CheY-like chemotaxis protein